MSTALDHVILMTQDSLQLQKTVLVVAGSDSPVTSAVSTLLSSWKLECARDNEEALALVEESASTLLSPTRAVQAGKMLNCFERYGS